MKTSTAGLGLLLFASLAFLPFRASSQDVILQGFYWNTNPGDITDVNNGLWWDTITLVSPYLADLGFKTVWTPPATKGSGIYDMGYGTYDYYDFGDINQQFTTRTRHGSKVEMLAMIEALHDEGLLAMADLVLNHRGSANAQQLEDCDDGDGLQMRWTDFNPGSGRLPMDAWDFHPNAIHCDLNAPYHDRLFFEDLCYFNFLDQTLDPLTNDWYYGPHNLGKVGDSLIVWGRYLLDDIGFDELRLDAVKHIEPGFLAPFLVEMETPDQPFAVGELFDGNLGVLKGYHDEVEGFVSNYGIGSKDADLAIFDFNLRYALRDMCNNGGGGYNMWDLNSTGLRFNPSGGLDGEDIVTFVENHDVDRIGWQVVPCASPHQQQVGATCLALYTDGGHDPITSDKEDMGYPYIMAAEGRPTVFWKDLFWYGLDDDISWQMALRDETASGDSDPIQDLAPFFSSGNGGDLFVLNRDGASGAANDGGMVLALNDHSSSEASVWVNTPFSDKYLKDYSDGYLFVSTQAFADSRANVKAQSRDYSWWSLTGLYPKPAGTAASHFQMDATPGGCPHFIALRVADAPNLLVNGAPIAVGDEVAVKNGNGDIVGIGRIGQDTRWDGVHDMIIEALGTKSANGMSNGETFTFVAYDVSAAMEFTIGQVQYAAVGNTFSFSPDRPDSPNRNGNFSSFNISASRQGLYGCEGISRVLAFESTVEPPIDPCGAASMANASVYDNELQAGDNDGAGFLAWTGMVPGSSSGFAGYFVGSSTANGDGDSNLNGDIDSGGKAWGFYANTNNLSEGTRPFASPMTPGTTLSFKMDNGWLDDPSANGTVGFGLRNSSSENLMEFYFKENNSHYTINDATGSVDNNSGILFTDEGLQIEIQLMTLSSYQLRITPIGGATTTFTRNLYSPGGGQAPDRVRFFNFSAGSGPQRNLYFNSLQLCELPALLINEVDYDQVGDDEMEFIELKNQSTVSVNLDAYTLELVNGGTNTVYRTVNLPNTILAPGDYYVICGVGSTVPNCDFNFDGALADRIQNGAPDAVRLLWNTVTTDALSYEGDVPGAVEGSGTGLEDSNTIPEVGLSRVPDGADTDQNNIDFELTCITPGETNTPDNTDTDDDDSPDVCDDCPLAQSQGSIANFDVPNCACLPGYYAVTSVVNGQEVITGCQICPPGTYCPDGILAYPCQAGSFQDLPGQTSCIECVPGRFSSVMGSVFCTLCPAGEYQSESGATSCIDCPPGQYQSATGSASCLNCEAGTFNPNPGATECVDCLPGTYQSAVGATSCLNCEAGTFNPNPGATECVDCPPGQYQGNTGAIACLSCEAGTFNPNPGATECVDCPPGQYQGNTGAIACLNCEAGTFNPNPGATECVDCPPGQYQGNTGAIACLNCEAGTFNPNPGAIVCNDCPPGKYQPLEGAVACLNCEAGTFNPDPGATECENCPPGKYQPTVGAVLCQNCPTGTYASMNGQVNCETCEPGSVAPFSGSALCVDCMPPDFSFCPTVSAVDNDPGLCEANVVVPMPVLSDMCTRNHALHFDGSNDYVNLGAALLPTTTNTAFTIEAWIRTTDGDGAIVSQYAQASPLRFIFFIENDKLNYWRGNNLASSTASVNDGVWHHVAVTRTQTGAISLFIDGVQDGTGSDNSGFSNTSTMIGAVIFNGSPSRPFTGEIDEVRIWSTARSQTDIQAAMNLEINSTYPGLTAFYHFNEGIACCENTGLDNLPDGMAGYDGTLSGFSLATGCTSNWTAGAPALGDPLTLTNDWTNDCGDVSGIFPVGATVVTWTAMGANGATETCSITVTVNDVEPPTISCPSDFSVSSDPGECTALVNFAGGGSLIWTDDFINSLSPTNAQCQNWSDFLDLLTPTTYASVTIKGTFDPVGITITDPVAATQLANLLYTETEGSVTSGGHTWSVYKGCVAFSCVDQPDGVELVLDEGNCTCAGGYTIRPHIGNENWGGVNTYTCYAPSQTMTLEFTISGGGGPVTIDDNCPGAILSQTAGLPDGSVFPLGMTLNTFEVTDGVNPPVSCSFTVTVEDNEPPSITCPSDISVDNDPGQCCAVVDYIAPMGTDNCPDPMTIQTEGQASGFCFPVGSTLNTFEVTDGAGLTASCSFWVNVADVELPSIACPTDISVDNDPGQCCATVNYVAPAGTDNCPNPITTQINGLPDGDCFPVGMTTNVFEVIDATGNPATCSFSVMVDDTELPVLDCPANIVAVTDPGECTAVVNFADPVFSDNCSSGGSNNQIFGFTGAEEIFVVPDGVYSIFIEALGAQGGESYSCTGGPNPEFDGGLGGYAAGTLAVTPGQTLYINVGGKGLVGDDGPFDGGWNGGGDGGYWGGGGGGGSDVRTISGDLSSRLLVGGGGGGGNTGCSDHGAGGGGGGLIGIDGLSFNGYDFPTGGTQVGGGIGQNSGENGSFGQGGNAPGGENHVGGGGGGWYGGGSAYAAGGAGGSSYIGGVAGGSTIAAIQTGDGLVAISWLVITQTAGLPSGSPFPFGTTTNTFEVMDGAGNIGSCSFSVTVSGTPCNGGAITIIDPCTCLDNASTLSDGQFSETVEVSSGPGETWTVVLAPGLYQTASLAPPAAPLPVLAGTPLTEGPAGIYTLTGKHVDALGYSISVTNGSVTLSTSNTCYYPNPSLSGLNGVYCSQDGPQVATVTAQLGDGGGPATIESITFDLIRQSDNAVVSTQTGGSNTFNFDPSMLAQGNYTLRATFDAADDGAGHTGCEQAVEEDFEVRKVGCGEFPWDGN